MARSRAASINIDGPSYPFNPRPNAGIGRRSGSMRTADLDYELPPRPDRPGAGRAALAARGCWCTSGRPGRSATCASTHLLDQLDPERSAWSPTTPACCRCGCAPGGAPGVPSSCCCWSRSPTAPGPRWRGPTRGSSPARGVAAGGLEFRIDERLGEGRVRVTPPPGISLEQALEEAGEMPLPPYIHAAAADRAATRPCTPPTPARRPRPPPVCTSPTSCGRELRARHRWSRSTLGVGLDTFRPVAEDELDEHTRSTPSATRRAAAAAGSPRAAPTAGGWWRSAPPPCACSRRCRVDRRALLRSRGAPALHHPRLPLPRGGRDDHQLPPAALDAAGAGDGVRRVDETRRLYRTAIAERYRFYSFGDATLIL